MKPVGRRRPRRLLAIKRSSVFQKRWQIMIGQVNNLTRHLDQGVKRGCFPGQQYCRMLYKTVHSTLITINRNKVCNQVYPVGVMYRAIKTSDRSDWEFFYFYFLFALYNTDTVDKQPLPKVYIPELNNILDIRHVSVRKIMLLKGKTSGSAAWDN